MTEPNVAFPALTKREMFAAMAMQGILANPNTQGDEALIEAAAPVMVRFADALIAELEKGE